MRLRTKSSSHCTLPCGEAHAQGHGLRLGVARMEKGYRLDVRTWKPDVSVTRAGQAKRDHMEGSPAIAIELVSGANTPRALAIKTWLYFEFGALEVWHLFPRRRTPKVVDRQVAVHVTGADPVIVRDFVRTPLLPGFALNVQAKPAR